MKETIKKERKTNKKKLTVAIIIAIFILSYCSYSIYLLIKEPSNTFLIEKGKLYQEESVIGYVIRNEILLQGKNYKNGIIQMKVEGEKVAKGDSVFRYYSNNEESLTQKIQDLDLKIQEAMEKEENLYSGDMKLLDKQIEEKINEIGNTNDINKIIEYKKDINSKITKKAKIAGDLSPSGSYIRKLIDERSSYEKSLNEGAEYVKAPKSGIVSYRVDGLEETLTPESFSTINKKFLEDLNLKSGEIVASSEESGKVIDNFECYIAIDMDSAMAKQAKVGDKVNLRLSNSEEVTASIEYIIEEDTSRVLIFKITNGVELLSRYRKISCDVIWWSYSGLKVPNSSLIEENNLTYVVRNRAGYLDKVLVKVLKQNESYAIIDNYKTEELKALGHDSSQIKELKTIALYDEIITQPQ